jgi:hypothetical protein
MLWRGTVFVVVSNPLGALVIAETVAEDQRAHTLRTATMSIWLPGI